jgi:hypothetical protein
MKTCSLAPYDLVDGFMFLLLFSTSSHLFSRPLYGELYAVFLECGVLLRLFRVFLFRLGETRYRFELCRSKHINTRCIFGKLFSRQLTIKHSICNIQRNRIREYFECLAKKQSSVQFQFSASTRHERSKKQIRKIYLATMMKVRRLLTNLRVNELHTSKGIKLTRKCSQWQRRFMAT